MTGDSDDGEPPAAPRAGARPGDSLRRHSLRAVDTPIAAPEPAPAVRLRREWKGLTVADLLDGRISDRLPGKVRTALHHLQRGDLRSAERALPGEFGPILPGPGSRRRRRAAHAAAVVVAAVLAAAAFAGWWFA